MAVYLAITPKSDAVYKALGLARRDVRTGPAPAVPLHLRNAPTKLMREQGYAKGYEHAHEHGDAVVGMECMPEGLRERRYYRPLARGIEERIKERLHGFRSARAALRAEQGR